MKDAGIALQYKVKIKKKKKMQNVSFKVKTCKKPLFLQILCFTCFLFLFFKAITHESGPIFISLTSCCYNTFSFFSKNSYKVIKIQLTFWKSEGKNNLLIRLYLTIKIKWFKAAVPFTFTENIKWQVAATKLINLMKFKISIYFALIKSIKAFLQMYIWDFT